jgi:superfamily II DNA/RNA helicase
VKHFPVEKEMLLFSATLPEMTDTLKIGYSFFDTIEEGDDQTSEQVVQNSIICTLDNKVSMIAQHATETGSSG